MPPTMKILEQIGDTIIVSMKVVVFDELKEDMEMIANQQNLQNRYEASLESWLSNFVI
jgi:chaperonin cofactor prefoldin